MIDFDFLPRVLQSIYSLSCETPPINFSCETHSSCDNSFSCENLTDGWMEVWRLGRRNPLTRRADGPCLSACHVTTALGDRNSDLCLEPTYLHIFGLVVLRPRRLLCGLEDARSEDLVLWGALGLNLGPSFSDSGKPLTSSDRVCNRLTY